MMYVDALNAIIDDGIEDAKLHYLDPASTLKLNGSIAGFEACRNKAPNELKAELGKAKSLTRHSRSTNDPNYWYWRLRECQVEWVINVMSCILRAQGQSPIGEMIGRGLTKAADIIGVGVTRQRLN